MDGDVILSVEGLAKSFGRIQALAGVDLTVRAGEFVALLGPNGAGKSTLLQLLTGLFSPDAGAIRVLGHDMRTNAVAALGRIGVVFQQPTLDPELTVAANLRFHADLHGLSRREAGPRIDAALARFDLAGRRDGRAGTLSGGNRRRLELARALLHRPTFLLMDEATVGLDPASRRDILSRLHRLKGDGGLGILWTTHLVDEAEQADRVVVLHHGAVRYDGAPAALIAHTGGPSVGRAFLKLTGEDAEASAG